MTYEKYFKQKEKIKKPLSPDFSADFKSKAVKLANDSDLSYERLAAILKIHPTTIKNWCKKAGTFNKDRPK